MFHTIGPIFRVLFQVVFAIFHGDIPRLMALMLRANRLLAMVKNTCGFCSFLWARCFFDLLIVPLSYNFEGHFKSTYFPISLEFQPLEAVKPSVLAFEPSVTHTLIRQ
jgi:hypothetical protein